jgi:AhpD family alkylhydroperoxidase
MTERITFKDVPKGLMEAMYGIETFLKQSDLDHKLLHLVKTRSSQINGCAYCIDMHYKEAIHDGETAQRLMGLSAWRDTTYYTDAERAALEFTEILTQISLHHDREHIHDELAKYFNKGQIAMLSLAIAQINSWNRLMASYGTTAGNYKVGQH